MGPDNRPFAPLTPIWSTELPKQTANGTYMTAHLASTPLVPKSGLPNAGVLLGQSTPALPSRQHGSHAETGNGMPGLTRYRAVPPW
jgi:hypothetical protein